MTVYFYALFVHLSINVYIFLKGVRLLENRRVWRNIFIAFFSLEFALYLTGLFFYSSLPSSITRFLWLMGSTWMVFIFYMTLLWLLIDLMLYINKRRPFLGNFFNAHPHSSGGIFFIVTTLSVAAIMFVGNYKFRHPVVTHQEITLPKGANRFSSLRIVMIADLHLGYLINRQYAKLYVDLINEQKPDLILFVGDVIDAELAPLVDQKMHEEFVRLQAPLGVFGCTGNHEYRYEAEEKIEWINNKAQIAMLRDSAVFIDESFYLVGREDWVYPKRKALANILAEQNVNFEYPVIVLNHSPYNLSEESQKKVDIALYGHTHDGQIFPFNIFTRIVFEVARGYKQKEHTHVYITSGVGLSGPQYRIGTKSEIVLLDVTFDEK